MVQDSKFMVSLARPQSTNVREIPDARPEDFRKATEQVFHRKDAASGVELMVLIR